MYAKKAVWKSDLKPGGHTARSDSLQIACRVHSHPSLRLHGVALLPGYRTSAKEFTFASFVTCNMSFAVLRFLLVSEGRREEG